MWQGAIDCDVHPRAPSPRTLSRYMDELWRETVEVRGIDTWNSIAYPPNAPLTMRPDWREAKADVDAASVAKATLDRFGFAHAILNCLFPLQTFRDENLARRLRPGAERLAGGGMAGQGPPLQGAPPCCRSSRRRSAWRRSSGARPTSASCRS